jgi:WD40 repeat protein
MFGVCIFDNPRFECTKGEIMQGQNRQRKTQLILLVLTLLCGCSPTAAHQPENPTVAVDISTPVAGEISNSTVDDLVLLDTFNENHGRVLSLDLSSDGAWLVYSGQDRTVTLWEVETNQAVRTFLLRSVDMTDLDISPDDQLLATGEAIWDLETGEEIQVLMRGSPLPAHVEFSPDGTILAVGLLESEISLWDVASGEPIASFPQEEENRTKAMAFSPDGALLAAGVIDGSIRLYDIARGELINTLHYPGETDIHDLAISPDGNYLAAGGRYPALILWDLQTGEVVRTFGVHDDIYSVAFSPEGTIVAAGGGYEEAVLLWDIESGRLLRTLPMENKSMAIVFSADGRLLVAGDFDGQIYLWGIPTNP